MTHALQNTIELAWEGRANLTPMNAPEVRVAVDKVIADLNKGRIRVAERQGVGSGNETAAQNGHVCLLFRDGWCGVK